MEVMCLHYSAETVEFHWRIYRTFTNKGRGMEEAEGNWNFHILLMGDHNL